MIQTVLQVLAALFIIEIVLLLWLYFSVGNYKKFWENKATETGEITYVALGDSAAQAIGASSPMRGYVGLIAKQLQSTTGKRVKLINLSVTGATVRDCLKDQIPKLKDIKADYITIEIGANDVKAMNPEQFKADFDELLPKLPKGTYVSNMPLFNSRPKSTVPAKDLSRIVETAVAKDRRLHLVDLQKQTMEHQSIFGFAPDLFHPNNLSYKNWYQAFWNEMQKEVTKR